MEGSKYSGDKTNRDSETLDLSTSTLSSTSATSTNERHSNLNSSGDYGSFSSSSDNKLETDQSQPFLQRSILQSNDIEKRKSGGQSKSNSKLDPKVNSVSVKDKDSDSCNAEGEKMKLVKSIHTRTPFFSSDSNNNCITKCCFTQNQNQNDNKFDHSKSKSQSFNNISPVDQILLSPWKKWRTYGMFPWKFLLHLLLIILISTIAILMNSIFAGYSRAMGRNFTNILVLDSTNNIDITEYGYSYIYTIKDTIDATQNLITNYFDIPNLSVGDMLIFDTNLCDKKVFQALCKDFDAPAITISLLDPNTLNVYEEMYQISESTSPWPLSSNSEIVEEINKDNIKPARVFFDSVQNMEFKFNILSNTLTSKNTNKPKVSVLWEIFINYKLIGSGQWEISMYYHMEKIYPIEVYTTYMYYAESPILEDEGSDSSTLNVIIDAKWLWINCKIVFILCSLIMLIAFSFQCLTMKSTARHAILLKELSMSFSKSQNNGSLNSKKTNLEEDSLQAEKQPLLDHEDQEGISENVNITGNKYYNEEEKSSEVNEPFFSVWESIGFFNLWNLVSTISNIFTIIFCITILYTGSPLMAEPATQGCIGISCFTIWLSILQYMEFNPRYYVLIITLRTAVPRIAQFLIGILPVFMGYSLLGLVFFGNRREEFGSIVNTWTTLFGVVNGDSILDTINAISFHTVLGPLYICFYMMLFTYVCLMTCIAIVEEAFFTSADEISQKDVEDSSDTTSPKDFLKTNYSDFSGDGISDITKSPMTHCHYTHNHHEQYYHYVASPVGKLKSPMVNSRFSNEKFNSFASGNNPNTNLKHLLTTTLETNTNDESQSEKKVESSTTSSSRVKRTGSIYSKKLSVSEDNDILDDAVDINNHHRTISPKLYKKLSYLARSYSDHITEDTKDGEDDVNRSMH